MFTDTYFRFPTEAIARATIDAAISAPGSKGFLNLDMVGVLDDVAGYHVNIRLMSYEVIPLGMELFQIPKPSVVKRVWA